MFSGYDLLMIISVFIMSFISVLGFAILFKERLGLSTNRELFILCSCGGLDTLLVIL